MELPFRSAAFDDDECPSRVKLVVSRPRHALPLYPHLQTYCCLAANDVPGQKPSSSTLEPASIVKHARSADAMGLPLNNTVEVEMIVEWRYGLVG